MNAQKEGNLISLKRNPIARLAVKEDLLLRRGSGLGFPRRISFMRGGFFINEGRAPIGAIPKQP